MKLKTLICAGLWSCMASLYAASEHGHPNASSLTPTTNTASSSTLKWPGSCEIEILNHSYNDVRVNGVFDDGSSLIPFNVYSFDAAQYISLFYYGYCHDGMDLYIDTFYGNAVYAGYVRRYSTIRIVPSVYGSSQLKATVQSQ